MKRVLKEQQRQIKTLQKSFLGTAKNLDRISALSRQLEAFGIRAFELSYREPPWCAFDHIGTFYRVTLPLDHSETIEDLCARATRGEQALAGVKESQSQVNWLTSAPSSMDGNKPDGLEAARCKWAAERLNGVWAAAAAAQEERAAIKKQQNERRRQRRKELAAMRAIGMNTPVEEINWLHTQICAASRTTLDKAIRIGELLAQQKSALKHGQWLPWLKANVEFSHKTATSYMHLWDRRSEFETVSNLGLTDAYRLLAGDRQEERTRSVSPEDQEAIALGIERLPRVTAWSASALALPAVAWERVRWACSRRAS